VLQVESRSQVVEGIAAYVDALLEAETLDQFGQRGGGQQLGVAGIGSVQ